MPRSDERAQVQVNVNARVRVHLTDEGLAAWRTFGGTGRLSVTTCGRDFESSLWGLMRIFGPSMRVGAALFQGGTVIVDEEPAPTADGSTALTVLDLARESYETAKAKGWHDEDESPPSAVRMIAWMGLAMSEAAEAIEAIRVGQVGFEYRADGKPEGLPSELADIIIRVCDSAGALGIDIERALREKLTFNRTRSHKHGGKAA